MNNWMKQGLIGLSLTSAAISASAANKIESKEAGKDLNAQRSFGTQNIDAQDYAGGSKLKDRMIRMTGKSAELMTVTEQA
jgi:hypothetical protein